VKAVILAGGYGSRISEETHLKPKPMVTIGGKPILWHIMKIYSHYGIHDFVICLGYKGYVIKEFFANYFLHRSDVTIDLRENRVRVHQDSLEPWSVTLIDTGESTMTGGRLRRVREHVGDGDFCFTYGDGVAALDIRALIALHRQQGRLATVTAVKPPGRFGALDVDGNRICRFEEKPPGEAGWVSGGFFVLSPGVFDYIEGDGSVWEQEPLQALAREGRLSAFRHEGFWRPMDTLRDRAYLENLWETGEAPWRIWEDPVSSHPSEGGCVFNPNK
jgi:glucose-1-phosphate cytidylyltransferase